MPKERPNPYHAFNFRLTVDRFGDAGQVRAGFNEISGMNIETTLAEYRNGNELENHVRKIPGLVKAGDVVAKRGLMGSNDFFNWMNELHSGIDKRQVQRNVVIELLDEAHESVVMTWTLVNAVPMKVEGPTLNAKGGTDVAIEAITFSSERIIVGTP
jgi:phage tail-like protein